MDPIVRAPEDGEIGFVFDTKHAIGFVTDFGVSLLIHVGIDTVKAEREQASRYYSLPAAGDADRAGGEGVRLPRGALDA